MVLEKSNFGLHMFIKMSESIHSSNEEVPD